jgi:hypothetical protein
MPRLKTDVPNLHHHPTPYLHATHALTFRHATHTPTYLHTTHTPPTSTATLRSDPSCVLTTVADWIYLAHHRDRWLTFVNSVLKIRFVGNFLTSWGPVSLSRRTLLRGFSKFFVGLFVCPPVFLSVCVYLNAPVRDRTMPWQYRALTVPCLDRDHQCGHCGWNCEKYVTGWRW